VKIIRAYNRAYITFFAQTSLKFEANLRYLNIYSERSFYIVMAQRDGVNLHNDV